MRLTELEARAHTMADIARTLTAERGDSAEGELVAWAEAVRAAIESHARDLDAAIPWARLVFGKAPINRATIPEQDLVSTTMARFFLSFPTLADTPDRCESAIGELTTLRARLASRQRRTERCPCTNRCDHRESRAFGRSLRSAGPPPFNARNAHENDVRRDGVWLSLRPDPQALLDRLPRCR